MSQNLVVQLLLKTGAFSSDLKTARANTEFSERMFHSWKIPFQFW